MKNLLYLLLAVLFVGNAMAGDKDATGSVGPVKFSGLMFADYFYNVSAHDSTQKNANGFALRRIYITSDYDIADNFSTRFRLESDQIGKGGGKNEFGVMVKDAWLKWKDIFKGSDLVFGISPTPAFDVSEGAWGHRYLEKTIMDLNHIVSSRDFGADLKGKFDEKGTAKYWVKIGNNSGNAPESNKDKRFYGLLEFVPSPTLVITVYGDYASGPTVAGKDQNAFVAAGFINYKQKGKFSIGVEGFMRSIQNAFAPPSGTLGSLSSFGLSVWAYANFSDKAQIVGRFDTFDPNTDASSNKDGKNLILVGLQLNPADHVSITPNVEIFSWQADSPNNGDKSDVTPRITFFWSF